MKPEHTRRFSSFYVTFLVTFTVAIFLTGCGENLPVSSNDQTTARATTWVAPQSASPQRNFSLLIAEWMPATSTLKVAGTSNNNSERISIKNSTTDTALASTLANRNLNWSVDIKSPSVIPCTISAISESGTLKSNVKNAPANCNSPGNSSLARAIVTLTYPEAIITSPQTDLTIALNESVDFEASANNAAGTPSFSWIFSGAAPNSAIQNPGRIKFSKTGVYHVALDVTDSRGLSDPTPPMRMIHVVDSVSISSFDSVSILAAEPIANIDTPAGDQIIMVGGSLNFSGSGSDPASPDPVVFMWDFGGAAESTSMQNPGDIFFNTTGTYTIVLSVSDSVGNIGTSQIEVTVIDSTANQPPVGMITSPVGDLMINPGDTIDVQGEAVDPEGDAISYLWEFDGVIPDSTTQAPGMVTYPDAGVYTITLTATDSSGLSDPNPPTRVITVQAAAPISSDMPNGEILTPAMDTTIMAGESITFTASGSAPAGNEPLLYIWSFNGVAPNSTAMDTGPITFPNPGIYTITLLVVDATAQFVPTPAVRVITVTDPAADGTPPSTPMMVGHIEIPQTDVTIAPGGTVNFVGSVEPEINPPYSFLWLFDGAAKNFYDIAPGDVVFNDPGMYNVMFFAIDKDGVFDTRPAKRIVTVADSTATPSNGPITSITNPAGDITINTGDTISFTGNVIDVAGNGAPFSYSWTFGGAAQEDSGFIPPPVTFNMAGTYVVTFTATDTNGNGQSSSVTITVVDPATPATPTPGSPVAEIIIEGDVTTITAGDSVNFMGNSGGATLEYLWTFGGAADNSNLLSPGPITFTIEGIYEVVFTVTDPGNSIITTTTVTITVMPAGPQGIIDEPAGDQTITVGGTLQFSGSGINPIDDEPLNYSWDFGNGTVSTAQVPGIVTFNQVGVFIVTLTVDLGGVDFDQTPAQITVTVEDNGGGNTGGGRDNTP